MTKSYELCRKMHAYWLYRTMKLKYDVSTKMLSLSLKKIPASDTYSWVEYTWLFSDGSMIREADSLGGLEARSGDRDPLRGSLIEAH